MARDFIDEFAEAIWQMRESMHSVGLEAPMEIVVELRFAEFLRHNRPKHPCISYNEYAINNNTSYICHVCGIEIHRPERGRRAIKSSRDNAIPPGLNHR